MDVVFLDAAPVVVDAVATAVSTWPHEAVPDGHIDAPHHVYVGLGVLAFVAWRVSDDRRRREPALVGAGAMLTLFAFATIWQWYATVGAALSLVGLCVALAGIAWPGGVWEAYPRRERVAALAGALVALDDVVDHAFAVGTPLDAFWMHVLYPVVRSL